MPVLFHGVLNHIQGFQGSIHDMFGQLLYSIQHLRRNEGLREKMLYEMQHLDFESPKMTLFSQKYCKICNIGLEVYLICRQMLYVVQLW